MSYIVAWAEMSSMCLAFHKCEWFQSLAGAKEHARKLVTKHGVSTVDVAEVIGTAKCNMVWDKEPKEPY